jgi:hypothetical protein
MEFSLSEFVASHPMDNMLIMENEFGLYREDWEINL